MIKPIGEFIIIEEYGGGKHETGIELFNPSDVRIVQKEEGAKVTIYENSAEKFLRHLKWMNQFIDLNKLENEMKNWRR